MKIQLTNIYVNDPNEAFKFYTEVLGFVEKVYMPDANLAIVASPEQPDGAVLLLEPNDTPIAKTYQEALYNEGYPAIVFGVDDIQQEVERLKQQGIVFRQDPTQTDAGMIALFDDTCGNLIQLFQG